MADEKRSWGTITTHVMVKEVMVKHSEDKWNVDHSRPIATRSVKIAYGEMKVVSRYGKK